MFTQDARKQARCLLKHRVCIDGLHLHRLFARNRSSCEVTFAARSARCSGCFIDGKSDPDNGSAAQMFQVQHRDLQDVVKVVPRFLRPVCQSFPAAASSSCRSSSFRADKSRTIADTATMSPQASRTGDTVKLRRRPGCRLALAPGFKPSDALALQCARYDVVCCGQKLGRNQLVEDSPIISAAE